MYKTPGPFSLEKRFDRGERNRNYQSAESEMSGLSDNSPSRSIVAWPSPGSAVGSRKGENVTSTDGCNPSIKNQQNNFDCEAFPPP